MSSRIILLTLRTVALIVAVGVVLIIGRDYILSELGTSFVRWIYGVFGLLVLWITLWLSTRSLLLELRSNRRHVSRSLPEEARSERSVGSSHKYPLRLAVITSAFGLCLVSLPFLSATPNSSVAPVMYICSFGAATVLFVIALWLLLYSVTIKRDGIVVSAFTSKEIAFEQIAETSVVTTRNGPQIVVSLKNGHVLRFGRQLTGFIAMRDVLMSKSSSG